MYGFTKVDWTDHEFAAFVQKHDLNSFSPGPAVKWTRQGAYPLVHATVIFDNAAMSRNI